MKEKVFSILAGMQCLRDLEKFTETKDGEHLIFTATTVFGRNGHGHQSDYLYTIAKTVERLEQLECTAQIEYIFDTLDDVGHVNWKIYY